MSALICQRPSSIDRRDKRLGNGQARSRRHRIKRAVSPIPSRSFRVRANYLDALNASRVRIHRQKPKALGLKFGCGFTRHLLHQGSPASGYRPLGGGAVTAQAQAGPVISDVGSHFETGSKGRPPLLHRPSRGCLLVPCRRSSQSSLTKSWRHQLAARPDPVRRRMRPMLARLPLREQT